MIKETQARYASFIQSSNPNPSGYATWSRATSSVISAIQLGGTGTAAAGACEVGFFGGEVSVSNNSKKVTLTPL